jgi:hypothetical protein
MRKWWWWWLPGWHRKWKLEKRRIEALSSIVGERLFVFLDTISVGRRDSTGEFIYDTPLPTHPSPVRLESRIAKSELRSRPHQVPT